MGLLKRDPSAGGIVRRTTRANFRDWLLRRGTKMEDAYSMTLNRERQRRVAVRVGGGATKNLVPPRKRKKPSAHARHIARMKQRNQGGKERV